MIAVGGMGEVFSGWDSKLDRPVAIKLLRRDMVEQPDFRERFEAEIRAAGRLTHSGVVAVFDTGEHEGLPFMVMELLSGRTLADELQEGAADPDRAISVALQILDALRVAHREEILHRDLKPSNILLADDGSVKVADFGVAKMAGGRDLTQTGTMVGTAAYLAPERIEGRPAGRSSDLYAVGAILFELLAGFKPFQADTPLGLMRAIGQDMPPDLQEVRPELDPALAAIVAKAMAKDPERRYASAWEMADELGELSTVAVESPTSEVAGPGEASTEVLATGGADHAKTEVIRTSGARHRAGGSGFYKLAGVAAAVLAVIIVVMLVSRNLAVSPVETPDSGAASGSISPELEEALDDLEEAVNP